MKDVIVKIQEDGRTIPEQDLHFTRRQTPLMLAAQLGRKDLCEWLIEKESNVWDADANGRRALDYAVQGGHKDTPMYTWLISLSQRALPPVPPPADVPKVPAPPFGKSEQKQPAPPCSPAAGAAPPSPQVVPWTEAPPLDDLPENIVTVLKQMAKQQPGDRPLKFKNNMTPLMVAAHIGRQDVLVFLRSEKAF